MKLKFFHRLLMQKKLERFLDGEVTLREAKAIQDHIRQCRACQAERNALTKLRSFTYQSYTSKLTGEEVTTFESVIERRLQEGGTFKPKRPILKAPAIQNWWVPLWKPALAFLILLVVVAIPITRLRHVPSNEAVVRSIRSDKATVVVLQTEQRGITVLWLMDDKKIR